MWTTADWVRLLLLLFFGLGALGFRGWIIFTASGAILAVILCKFAAWSWAVSFQAGLAAAFVLPIMFGILKANFRIAIGLAIIFGIPTLLLSKYMFSCSWIFAGANALTLMYLAPVAIARTMTKMGIIPNESKKVGIQQDTKGEFHPEMFRSGAPERGASSPIGQPGSFRDLLGRRRTRFPWES